MPFGPIPSIRTQAWQVLALTAAAWQVAPPSPQGLARRAPHGYVPVRVLRRLRKTASTAAATTAPFPTHRSFLAHSW